MTRWKNLMITMACAVVMLACMDFDAGAVEADTAPAGGGTVALYDTVEAGRLGDAVPALVGGGWKQIESGGTFRGDGALVNDRLAAIVRKDGSGVDLYAKGAGGWTRRCRLAPVAGNAQKRLAGLKGAVTPEGRATVEAGVEGDSGAGFVFEMDQPGFPALKATPRGKVEALRFLAPCRLGIMPDFWTDDLTIDARTIPMERMEIPSDNIFLHLVGDGDALVAAVWEKNERDIEVALAGEGAQRALASTDVFVAGGGSVWAAVLEQKSIWHETAFDPEKTKKLDWKVPFVAKWKGNIALGDGTVLSRLFKYKATWHDGRVDELVPEQGGVLSAVLKQDWKKVLADNSVSQEAGDTAAGSVLAVYPISRENETPLNQYCTDDLLRLLGTEACSYVLDLDGRTGESRPGDERGLFTCADSAIMGRLMPLAFPRNDRAVARFLKDERANRRLINSEVLLFITLVQDRINSFVNFRKELLVQLDGEEKKHPELAGFIGRLRTQITKRVPIYGSAKQDAMQLADGAARAQPLIEKRLKPLEVDTPENAAASLFDLRPIGDHQDGRVQGERLKVARLRVMATMEMARNPAARELAEEIRKRVQTILRNPMAFEKPRKW